MVAKFWFWEWPTRRMWTILRESPSLKIMELLTERGAKVDYNDPHFAELLKMRHYDFSERNRSRWTRNLWPATTA